MIRFVLFLTLLAQPLRAETVVVAARTIPAHSLISPADLSVLELAVPGGVSDPEEIIGMEARVALFAGRAIRPGDFGLPAIVERNQILPLIYQRAGLVIVTEGRSLDRAGPGDVIRVMNLASRNSVTATIGADGSAYVAY